MTVLEAFDLQVRFGQKDILKPVNLSLKKGRVTGLIGPNGAGKSTLLKCLGGLVRCGGQIKLGGTPLEDYPRSEAARRLGYLPQERPVHWPLTVETVVSLGRIPYLKPWQDLHLSDKEVIERSLEETGIGHLRHAFFDRLAGGEKALVMIARLLAGEPEIILADEPAAGLDPHHELDVFSLFRKRAENGAAVLMVLHNLTAAARFCDELYLLSRGEIRAAGPPAEVLTPANLETIYGIRAFFIEKNGERYILPEARI